MTGESLAPLNILTAASLVTVPCRCGSAFMKIWETSVSSAGVAEKLVCMKNELQLLVVLVVVVVAVGAAIAEGKDRAGYDTLSSETTVRAGTMFPTVINHVTRRVVFVFNCLLRPSILYNGTSYLFSRSSSCCSQVKCRLVNSTACRKRSEAVRWISLHD